MTTVTSRLCCGCWAKVLKKIWLRKKNIALHGHELKLPGTKNLIHIYAHTCTVQSGSTVVLSPSSIM